MRLGHGTEVDWGERLIGDTPLHLAARFGELAAVEAELARRNIHKARGEEVGIRRAGPTPFAWLLLLLVGLRVLWWRLRRPAAKAA